MYRYRKKILFLTIVLLLMPASGLARIGQWVPSIVDYEADMDIYGTYKMYDITTDDLNYGQKSLIMKENLNLGLYGYVYHPRLIEYKLRLSLGFLQDRYDTDTNVGSHSRSRTGTSNGFNFRTKILPMHPYNLELFFLRYESLSGSGFTTGPVPVSYSKGAVFKYERKPYFLTASYVNNTRETSTTSDWTSYLANFTYFKQYKDYRTLSLSGSLRRTEFSTSTSSDEWLGNSASLSNSISLRKLGIASSLRYYTSDAGDSSSNLFSWNEALTWQLPLNFRVGLNYNYSKSESEIPDVNTGESRADTLTSNGASFNISHKLYRSLSTSYSAAYLNTDSSRGSSESLSQHMGVSYVKNIPGGILRSGIGFSRRDTKRSGTISTIDAAFRQTVPRDLSEPLFLLEDETADIGSIIIYMLDPDVPEHRIRLEEGTNYIITPLGNAFEIEIIAVPPEFPDFATYDFLLSYESRETGAEYQTDTVNFRLSLDLFEKFYPYYSHYSTKQTVTSGSFPGGNYETITDTAGIQVVLMPFRFSASYTRVDSPIIPSNTWAFTGYYQKDLTSTSKLNAHVQYTNINYPLGTSGDSATPGTSGSGAYDEQRAGGLIGIVKRFPNKGVSLSASASYFRLMSLTDSDSYSINSSLSWKVYKFILEVGGSVNYSSSQSDIATTDRIYQNYYFHLRRKLF